MPDTVCNLLKTVSLMLLYYGSWRGLYKDNLTRDGNKQKQLIELLKSINREKFYDCKIINDMLKAK